LVLAFFLLRSLSGSGRPADAPQTVMVLVLNRTDHSTEYLDKIVKNRQEYANAHGMLFYPSDPFYRLARAMNGLSCCLLRAL
jgi:mannan polymerase II complex MNN11 subunit